MRIAGKAKALTTPLPEGEGTDLGMLKDFGNLKLLH